MSCRQIAARRGGGGEKGVVMQQESTGRSLASVSIFGLNASYTTTTKLQKLLQLTRNTAPDSIVFKRAEIHETVGRKPDYFVIKRFTRGA